jgi:ribonuclease T1
MRAALAALLVVCSTALALSGSVRLEALPPEARATLQRIEAGGPFPYARDGAVFTNRERELPMRERGYYREYTVKTPGLRDRGPRRIVAGRDGEYYYTDDHYRTFRRIIRP